LKLTESILKNDIAEGVVWVSLLFDNDWHKSERKENRADGFFA